MSAARPHPGLLFDKFVDGWSADWRIPEGAKKKLCVETTDRDVRHLTSGLQAALDRRHRLLEALRGRCLTAVTDWRFVSGLGSGHPFEAGFIWHRTLGVPYLPGSSVKGAIRAWAQEWEGIDEPTVRRLFGPEDEDARRSPDAGSLIVFDALPVLPPRLDVDVMNPHYAPYYSDTTGKIPPADYHSPVPIFFVTVAPGQPFEFAIALRGGVRDTTADLELGASLLSEAVTNLGAGGKTAVGYGVFRHDGPKK